mmetsp:Transcript_60467/g.179752  ORF Transcript_60467/g.179752 Transcript_60467/m.179752 type:complete len:209 (+) Transcript_60467:20-646(+)
MCNRSARSATRRVIARPTDHQPTAALPHNPTRHTPTHEANLRRIPPYACHSSSSSSSSAACDPGPLAFFLAFFLSRFAFLLAACAASRPARSSRSCSHRLATSGSSAVNANAASGTLAARCAGAVSAGASAPSAPLVASDSRNCFDTVSSDCGAPRPVERSSKVPLHTPLSAWNSRSSIFSTYFARSPCSPEPHMLGLRTPSSLAFGA